MPALNRLDAVFFRTRIGNEPVREWLKGLTKEQRKAIGEDIAYVQFKCIQQDVVGGKSGWPGFVSAPVAGSAARVTKMRAKPTFC